VVRASDLQPRGRRFKSQPLHVTTLGKLFTHSVPLFTKQYELVPAIGWEVNIGLASHWPCVTDSVVYPPPGSTAWEKEMSTPPKLHSEYYRIFTFTHRRQNRGDNLFGGHDR